jgi:hypothetical protein
MNHPHDHGVYPTRYRWEKHVLLDRRVSSHSRLRIFCIVAEPYARRLRSYRSKLHNRAIHKCWQRANLQSIIRRLPTWTALADIPSVRSVVSSTTVQVRRELPQLRELLFIESQLMPDALSMHSLTGLESLYAAGAHSGVRIALDCLPAHFLAALVHTALGYPECNSAGEAHPASATCGGDVPDRFC